MESLYRIVHSQVLGSFFFSSTTDFTDENNAFRFWVVEEDFQTVDKVGTVERITSDTHTERLT